MCGRTTLKITPEDLRQTFGYTVPADYRPRYNIAPTQPQLAIRDRRGERGFGQLRWGLIPFWADDPAIGNRLINARAESVMEKPAFREAFARRRCLIVVDGFYEWMGKGKGRRPHRIALHDESAFTLAGVWESWGRGEDRIESCAIITTQANAEISRLHDRMPVIITAGAREEWLRDDAETDSLISLLRPSTELEFNIYEVSTLVNSPANDLPECLDPVDEALLLL